MNKLPLFEDFIPAGFGVDTGQSMYSLGASPDFNTGYNMSAVVGPITELVNDIIEQSSLYEEDSDPSHTAESYIKEVKKYVNNKIDEAYESYLANESVVTEGKDDFMARYGSANINLKKGYKHHTEEELNDLYDKLGDLVKTLRVKDVTLVFESEVNEGVSKIACLDCDEVNTEKAWKKNNGFCPSCNTSTQGVAESVNEANDTDYDPDAHAERLKRRELQNIQRYRAAQDRGDNYAIALYELKIKMDKIDLEKLKVLKAIDDLKQKFDKI